VTDAFASFSDLTLTSEFSHYGNARIFPAAEAQMILASLLPRVKAKLTAGNLGAIDKRTRAHRKCKIKHYARTLRNGVLVVGDLQAASCVIYSRNVYLIGSRSLNAFHRAEMRGNRRCIVERKCRTNLNGRGYFYEALYSDSRLSIPLCGVPHVLLPRGRRFQKYSFCFSTFCFAHVDMQIHQ